MTAVICGSLAYDTIMVFPDQFKRHILADQIHILNVSFLVPQMRREYGGVAGNIAFNLKLLGGEPLPLGCVGRDFGPYRQWLIGHGIRLDYVRELDEYFTAQAFITTDQDDNQITAFHPGAMDQSSSVDVRKVQGAKLGIIAPDSREGMLAHAAGFVEAGVPFIFDPGQAMPLFSGAEFRTFLDQADWVCVNSYEGKMLEERTGMDTDEIRKRVKAYVVTHGAHGSEIFLPEDSIRIPAVDPGKVTDPTGCGDAFRAGIMFGLMNDLPWQTSGRIASLLGSIKVAFAGTQNHEFTRAEFASRFKRHFGYAYDDS